MHAQKVTNFLELFAKIHKMQIFANSNFWEVHPITLVSIVHVRFSGSVHFVEHQVCFYISFAWCLTILPELFLLKVNPRSEVLSDRISWAMRLVLTCKSVVKFVPCF